MPRYKTSRVRSLPSIEDCYIPEPTTGCWLWIRLSDRHGYGRIWIGTERREIKATKWSYQLAFGPVPDDLWVLHRCDTPACVNPRHLFLGTAKDNAIDREQKGRSATPYAQLYPETVQGANNGRSKLSIENSKTILQLLKSGISQAEIGFWYDVPQTTISKIKRGTHWTCKFIDT